MGIDNPLRDHPEEDKRQQENTANPQMEIDESPVEGDVNFNADIDQINDASMEEFPSNRQSMEEGWLKLLDVITALPISVRGLDFVLGGGTIAGFVLFMFSLFTEMGVAESTLAPWLFQIQIPYSSVLLAPSLIMVIIGGLHISARNNSECPECGDPIGLRMVNETVIPAMSDSRREHGKRTFACKSCDNKVKERFTRDRKET